MSILEVSLVGHGPFSPGRENRQLHPSHESLSLSILVSWIIFSAPFLPATPFLLAVEAVSDHAAIMATARADCHSGLAILISLIWTSMLHGSQWKRLQSE